MMFLIQGARGLYSSDGRRIYFPDRSWKDAKECLIKDYKVIRDKDTYAFIAGTPVVTEPISINDIPHFNVDSTYKELTIGDSMFILQVVGTEVEFYYKEDGILYSFSSTVNKDIAYLFSRAKSIIVDVMNYINENCKMDTEEKIFEALFRLMKKLGSYDVLNNDVYILDDTFIYFEKEYKYSGSVYPELYYYNNGELLSSDLDAYECKRNAKAVKKYSISDISKVMIQYGVSANGLATDVNFSDNLNRFNISADNFHSVVYAFKADKFTFEYYNSDKSALEREIVNQSIDAYNNSVKAIGKSLSSKNAVQFLNRINIRKYLVKTCTI